MHELFLPESLSRADAVERCDQWLSRRIGRWSLARRFLPRESRDAWVTLIAWHRLVREIGDKAPGFERRRGMDELESELDAALVERARSPVGQALSFTIRRHELQEELLRRPLLELRRDEHMATFETRESLLGHARALSIPEGRLLLRLAGQDGERNSALVDALAVAVQLADWLANLRRDVEQGRVRLPMAELARHGASLGALLELRPDPGCARVVAAQVAWARTFFARGWPLCAQLPPWSARRLAFVLRWHAARLSALEVARYEVLRGPPSGGWLRILACATASSISAGVPRLA